MKQKDIEKALMKFLSREGYREYNKNILLTDMGVAYVSGLRKDKNLIVLVKEKYEKTCEERIVARQEVLDLKAELEELQKTVVKLDAKLLRKRWFR